ncbi:MAG TPA: hypothetical protein VHV29_00880 [Terriglobales bacterium]|nr:hypothetical protein [Terriglobales bacterium]
MARRPDIRQRDVRDQAQQNSEVMSTEELKQMRGSLSRISLNAARHAYHTAYARCRMVNDRVPSARSIQELVQVWKQLWKRR